MYVNFHLGEGVPSPFSSAMDILFQTISSLITGLSSDVLTVITSILIISFICFGLELVLRPMLHHIERSKSQDKEDEK